jgi:hypothetical protein
MSRKKAKLSLKKETLRKLDSELLRHVAGGSYYSIDTNLTADTGTTMYGIGRLGGSASCKVCTEDRR